MIYFILFILGLPFTVMLLASTNRGKNSMHLHPAIILTYPLAISMCLIVFISYVIHILCPFNLCLYNLDATSLTIVIMVALLYFVFRKKAYTFLKSIWLDGNRRYKSAWLAVFLLIVISLTFRLAPYYGKSVYAGYDIKLYSYIASLIQDQNRFIPSIPEKMSSLSTFYDSHFLFPGSEIVVAYLSKILDIEIPLAYSLILLLLNSLYGVGVISLLNALLSDSGCENILVGFLASLSLPYPYYFIHWGGVGETFVWFLYPIFLSNIALINDADQVGNYTRLLTSIVMLVAAFIMHPISACLLTILASFLIFLSALRKGGEFFKRGLMLLIFSIGILSPHLIYSINTLYKLHEEQLPGIFGWEGFEFNYASLLLFILFGSLNLIDDDLRSKSIPYVVWLALLHVIMFYNSTRIIVVPLLFYFIPARLSIISLWALIVLIAGIIIKGVKKLGEKNKKIQKISVIMIAVIISGLGGWNLYATYETVEWGNSLTVNDLAAFEWIKSNTEINDVFLVNEADASPWLPVFTKRNVVCFPHVTNDLEVLKDCQSLQQLLKAKNGDKKYIIQTLMMFVEKYDVKYVFISERNEYSKERYNLDLLFSLYENDFPVFTLVFKQDDSLVLRININ